MTKEFVPKLTSLVLFFGFLRLSKCYLENVIYDGDSEWSPFCSDELFYKPYVRIREGRNGAVIKDMGPGLFEVKDMENLYVCANGLVYLYFKIREKGQAQIYDDAVVQYASHYCSFYNGKPGPGISERVDTLVAILLLGHPQDYRQISLQMFNAPLYDPFTKTTINFTSLAIINTDGECILEKGREKARIRIKGNPSEEMQKKVYEKSEEHYITMCRLDGHLLVQNDTTKMPVDTEWASPEDVLNVLSLTVNSLTDLALMGCYKYPLMDHQQVEVIEKRKNSTTKEDYDLSTGKSEWNPEDGAGLKFWTPERLESYGNPVTATSADEATLMIDVTTKNETLNSELAKDKNTSDATAIENAEGDLRLAILKLKLTPYLKHYQSKFEAAKKYAQTAKEAWDNLSAIVNDVMFLQMLKNYTTIQEEMSLLNTQKLTEPYNTKAVEKFNEDKIKYDALKEEIWAKTLELGPQITQAEVLSARRGQYNVEIKWTMDKIQKLISVYENKSKPLDSDLDFKDPPVNYKDTLISIRNPTVGTSEDNPVCMTLQRKEDQCKFVKPLGKRSCQLAKMKINGSGEWPGGAGDFWRDQVLEFLDKIFSKACTGLQGNFARGINNIVKAYLINKPEAEIDKNVVSGLPSLNRTRHNFITNYKISKPEDFNPPLPKKDAAPWDDIIGKLQKCQQNLQPLEFTIDSAHNKPLRILFNGNTLPNIVEQADMEFSFNWAVDTNFRIFATVLGLCAKEFDGTLAKKFYEGYTKSFLEPIHSIWLSNRDNPILKVVVGQYYVSGKGDLWTRQCMEASYIRSGKPQMRPIRNILVNSYTEHNFIVKGPGNGTRGPFYVASSNG